MVKAFIAILLLCPFIGFSQNLTSSTSISITKNWSQQPNGYTYPMNIFVPTGTVPQGGFPVCILLHGNGGNGAGMINQFRSTLECHILVAPTGYLNSWNICAETSDAPDIEMVNDLVTNVQRYTNVNPNKIRIVGSSNGAGLANRVFIENNNPSIDIICVIVSHLNEAQYHSGGFYKPSNTTDLSASFCGYNTLANPLTTRKYLSISNDNDNLIPYLGGSSAVGVNFLPAETAAFNIAVYKGHTGSIVASGVTTGNPAITEYSYLSGNVVHIKGNAAHSTNTTQREYVKKYFSDCVTTVGVKNDELPRVSIYPNPTSKSITINVSAHLLGSAYTIYDSKGTELLSGIIHTENTVIELNNKPAGMYFIKFKGSIQQIFKVLKQ